MTTHPPADDPQNVDDVLSSIRKLVSDEVQARSSEPVAEDGPHASFLKHPQTPDRTLVLTPELRVVDRKPAPLRLETPVTEEPVGEAPFQDEVALRALVQDVVREELQGELGARITRNVRKLIKREIAAALAAKDMGS